MVDGSRPPLHGNRDPYGKSPLPDGDGVPVVPREPDSPTTRQKLVAAFVVMIVVVGVVIGALR
ncbi:hypothetical protein [Salinispora arenicola]|uniref:hypothetical protein n=1 Tax=Salinispora arenicola TaxID=168697 RepID=UPI00037D83CE|nr:hypothetical protein [Salinispora arenicola]MCN0151765.1 hypothetical protein [Salinispora arenicola]